MDILQNKTLIHFILFPCFPDTVNNVAHSRKYIRNCSVDIFSADIQFVFYPPSFNKITILEFILLFSTPSSHPFPYYVICKILSFFPEREGRLSKGSVSNFVASIRLICVNYLMFPSVFQKA